MMPQRVKKLRTITEKVEVISKVESGGEKMDIGHECKMNESIICSKYTYKNEDKFLRRAKAIEEDLTSTST